MTIHGPSGQNESIPLQKLNTPDFISLPLDVARRDVVENYIAADVIGRLRCGKVAARFFQDYRELKLVIEFFGQMLGVNHRFIGADDGVNILKKDNPGKHRMGKACFLSFFVMLAKITGGMEEFLWRDRRFELLLRRFGRKSVRRRARLPRGPEAIACFNAERAALRL